MKEAPTRSDTNPPAGRKFFTLAEANKMLPLVTRIIADIVTLAEELQEKNNALKDLAVSSQGAKNVDVEDQLHAGRSDLEKGVDRLNDYHQEIKQLGVQLKDVVKGLIDFPCWIDGREIYLCWHHGETEVAFWHEVEAGFRGRQPVDSYPALLNN